MPESFQVPWAIQRRGRLYIFFVAVVAFTTVLALSLYPVLRSGTDNEPGSILNQHHDATPESSLYGTESSENHPHSYPTLESTKASRAYATFLTPPSDIDDGPIEDDKYFTAVRILIYQLLYAPETRTVKNYPFVVLVTPDLSHAKRDRLRRDGAIVVEAEMLDAGWVTTPVYRWSKVLAKLRLWELTQFERICFLDGDTILQSPIDEVFNDPAVGIQLTDNRPNEIKLDEDALPNTYAFASIPEVELTHHWPPSGDDDFRPSVDYFNAGFFVLQPSIDVFKYYTSLTRVTQRFDPNLPEQNLLNYAHRQNGNMPWRRLWYGWNIHFPSGEDLKGGVASIHDKWWDPFNETLRDFDLSWKWKMQGYFQARDALLAT